MGKTARDLLKIGKLDFQGEGLSLESVFLKPSHQFEHGMIEFNGNGGGLVDVFEECLFASHRFPLVISLYGPVVDAAGKVVEHRSHLAEHLLQVLERHLP